MTDKKTFREMEREAIKRVQTRFFRGNVRAMRGHWVAKEEQDERREKVLKPFYSKKFKEWF